MHSSSHVIVAPHAKNSSLNFFQKSGGPDKSTGNMSSTNQP